MRPTFCEKAVFGPAPKIPAIKEPTPSARTPFAARSEEIFWLDASPIAIIIPTVPIKDTT